MTAASPRPASLTSTKAAAILLTLLSLLSLALLLLISQQRLVGADEGFYAVAAKLFAAGKIPYADFFFPQMPLFPVIYSMIHWCGLPIWEGMRALSALLTMVGFLLLTSSLPKGDIPARALLLTTLSLSALNLHYLIMVKAYALTFVFLACGCYLLETKKNPRGIFYAGIAFGLATAARLLSAPALVGAAAYILLQRPPRVRNLILLGSGFLAGLAVCAPFLDLDFENFIFGNFGFHAGRVEEQDTEGWWRVFYELVGFENSPRFRVWIFPYLMYVSICSCVVQLSRTRCLDAASLIAWTLFAAHLLLAQPFIQYFCIVEPFFAISGTRLLLCVGIKKHLHLVLSFAVFVLCASSAVNLPIDIYRYTGSGKNIQGVKPESNPQDWSIQSVNAVSAAIDRHTAVDEAILSVWSGYLAASHALPFPGSENHFTIEYTRRNQLTEIERLRLHLLSSKDMQQVITSRRAHTVVLGPDNRGGFLREVLKLRGIGKVSGQFGAVIFSAAD